MLAQDKEPKKFFFWKGYKPRWWICFHDWECISLFATHKCKKCGKEEVFCPW